MISYLRYVISSNSRVRCCKVAFLRLINFPPLLEGFPRGMYFVPEGHHDRSQARSAWEQCPSNVPSRRVRFDRAQSIPEVFLVKMCAMSNRCAPPARIIPYPTGRLVGLALSQALRAWLRSACPSGTRAIRPSNGLASSQRLCGFNPREPSIPVIRPR
jgi:hypothetical protein